MCQLHYTLVFHPSQGKQQSLHHQDQLLKRKTSQKRSSGALFITREPGGEGEVGFPFIHKLDDGVCCLLQKEWENTSVDFLIDDITCSEQLMVVHHETVTNGLPVLWVWKGRGKEEVVSGKCFLGGGGQYWRCRKQVLIAALDKPEQPVLRIEKGNLATC